MPYVYEGDPDRVYPSLGLIAEPGDSRDDPEPLDWRWLPAESTTQTTPAPTSSSATPQPDASADGTTADPAPATSGGN